MPWPGMVLLDLFIGQRSALHESAGPRGGPAALRRYPDGFDRLWRAASVCDKSSAARLVNEEDLVPPTWTTT